jgi:hypothetical protein
VADAPDAQRLARGLNPYHAVTYFSPEASAAFEDAGLRGFWRGYFAGRAAPMGPVTAPVVTATFYGFAPHFVERAVPAVWSLASPTAALDARLAGVDATMRRVLGDDVCASAEMSRAASLAGDLAAACPDAGRPLGASNRALPVREEPHLALWQATTTLREDRGDAHIAVLSANDIGGCESQVLMVGLGAFTEEWIKTARGWMDEEWTAARDALQSRGLVDGGGAVTEQGRSLRAAIEARTDELATTGLSDVIDEVLALVAPFTAAIVESETIPFPNPVGLPKPSSR